MSIHSTSLSMNEKTLIELIYRHGEIARVDLTNATGMKAASITRLVAGLAEIGLLTETIDKSGTRGQPRKLLSLRKTEFRSVGIYIYFNKMVGILIDLNGKVYQTHTQEFTIVNAGELAIMVHDITKQLLRETNTSAEKLVGTGLSIPGNFGSYSNRVSAHELFSVLDGMAIYREVQKVCNWPVFFENDGTASALGEYLFANLSDADPLFLIHLGYGLGGGAIVNGVPFRGAFGNACLPGALFPYDGPRPTLQDFLKTLEQNELSLECLKSTEGQLTDIPVIKDWAERAARQLQFAVQIVSGMFDPKTIVLGGALPTELIEQLALTLQTNPAEGPSRGLTSAPVKATALGELSGPIGAASLPFYATFFPGSSLERGNSYLNGRG